MTTLHGSTSRVFDIRGTSNVELAYLGISGGTVGDGDYGGGIRFGGSGSLTLIDTSVVGNLAGYGGGVAVQPSGAAQLTLLGSYVTLNEASHDGGGVWLGGGTTLYSDARTQIFANDTADAAGGRGGAMFIGGPATAYVTSSVHDNTAGFGGAIYTYGEVAVNLYSSDASSQVSVSRNKAAGDGGAVYLYARTTAATLCAQDFALDANSARNGTAIMTDGPHANVRFNDPTNPCVPSGWPYPPVACTSGPGCNEIADNVSQFADGTPADGATIRIGTSGGNTGAMWASRFAARRNTGGSVVYTYYDAPPASGVLTTALHDCVIADNTASWYSIASTGDQANTVLVVDNCTVTNESQPPGDVFLIYGHVSFIELTNSILYNPGLYALHFASEVGTLLAQYDLLNDANGVPGTGVVAGVPSFVDAAHGDYHLQPYSAGVDVAPDDVTIDVRDDLDGHPRVVDLPAVANAYGPLDLGAYEVQSSCVAADTIFCDGFEGS